MNEKLLGNRYRLSDLLGSGGEARVFRAVDTDTNRNVAARLPLRPGTVATPPVLPTQHPGWVQLLDSGLDSEQGTYQILELLEGPTLSESIKSAPLELTSWNLFVEQSLAAVEALHAAGWIHGDLNADNFMRSGPGKEDWKLLELPFLRFDPPASRSALFGSIHTLAPEQLNGAPASIQSDLYALGCLYYYAASGEFPHMGANNQEIAIYRLRFEPVPLSEKAPHLKAKCGEWVMTLLARNPQNRFPSVAAARHLLAVA